MLLLFGACMCVAVLCMWSSFIPLLLLVELCMRHISSLDVIV